MGFVKEGNAKIFLFANAFLWGSSYVWSKMLLGYLPRYSILFLCSLGGLVSTVLIFQRTIKRPTAGDVLSSVLVSVFSIVSNTFFMLALQYTSSSNTAFIVQTSVILTPLAVAMLERRVPQGRVMVSAGIAFAGLFLLTCDFSSFSFKKGDLLALGNALFFTLFLVGQARISKKVDAVQFSLIHHTTNTAVFFTIAAVVEVHGINVQKLASPVFLGLITASICVAAFTVLFQSAAIKYVRPEKATLIYTLEPVTTYLLAFMFLGERPEGLRTAAGCLMILLAVLFSLNRWKWKKRGFLASLDSKPSY